MKILFDARWINNDSPDGITRYSRELIKALHVSSKLDLLISSTDQLNGLPKLRHILTNKPTSPKELRQARALNRYNYDIVFTPHFIFGGKGRNFRLVRTVHDLIPFNQKSENSKLAWKVFYANTGFLKKLLNDCEGVVTVSKVIAADLSKLTNNKIKVVYNAATVLGVKNKLTRKNILYIGRYDKYKNVETIVYAINDLPGYKVTLAGNCPESTKKQLLGLAKNKGQINFLGKITDKVYANELSTAFALVMPSSEEGFGLPVIEAMSVGCPVLCSDIPIFREIAGEAGVYFDLNSSAELSSKLKELEKTSLRQKISRASLINSKRFAWHSSANELQSFFRQINE
jgi:glycosyltransferase involved in cell wall biosynthesis